MTFKEACDKASRIARKTQSIRYVFLEDSMFGTFDVGSDFDAETWFLGSEPEAAFGPDGARLS